MSKLDPINLFLRCVIGFFAGFIVACFVLVFIGVLPPHLQRDLNTIGIAQQIRSIWLAFYIACAVAVFSMIFGRIQLSTYWFWFVIAFGLTCIIPVWPHKSGWFLPLATPYVNFGFEAIHLLMLAVQIVIPFVVARLFHRADVRNPIITD